VITLDADKAGLHVTKQHRCKNWVSRPHTEQCCHTDPWCQASVCERPALSSAFGLVRSSRSTTHLRTCCYATNCKQRATSGGRLQAGEIWLSSDRQ